MNTDITNTPDLWSTWGGKHPTPVRIPGSPDPGVWIDPNFRIVPEDEPEIERYLIWHWHWDVQHQVWRWQGAGLGLHTLVSADPLHLEPSIGCDLTSGVPDGCPAHGFIRNGEWIQL